MNKIELTMEMLEGEGSKIIQTGITTDEQINQYGWGDRKRPLKFVVVKGFINDWCIYLEDMNEDQTYERVRDVGNKICKNCASLLIDCNNEVLQRYRL